MPESWKVPCQVVKGSNWFLLPINILIEPKEKVDAGFRHSEGQVNSLVLVFHQANLIVSVLVLPFIWTLAKRLWKLKEHPWEFCAFLKLFSLLPPLAPSSNLFFPCRLVSFGIDFQGSQPEHSSLQPRTAVTELWSVSPIRKTKEIRNKGWKKKRTNKVLRICASTKAHEAPMAPHPVQHERRPPALPKAGKDRRMF